MKLLLIRHGETADNLKGTLSPVKSTADLTENGVQQAHALAPLLAKHNIEKIYCSPLARTKHTAETLAKELNIPFEIKEDLQERSWGDWGTEGKVWTDVQAIIKDYPIEKRYTFIPPNGESWKAMEERLLATINQIKKEHKANIAIVTHTGCLRALLPILKKDSIDNHQKYSVKTGTVTCFCTEKEDFDFIGAHS